MKHKFASFALLIGVAGCASTRSPATGTAPLEQVDRMEIYALDPLRPRDSSAPTLCGYLVAGHAAIDDPAERVRLAGALRRGSSEWITDNHPVMACMPRPHHGLRVEHAGVTTDYAICFECNDTIATSSDGRPIPSFMSSREAKPLFDEALRRHGLLVP